MFLAKQLFVFGLVVSVLGGGVAAREARAQNDAGLAFDDCQEEARLRSVEATDKASVTFMNSSSRAIKIFWLDYQGEREGSHAWIAESSKSGAPAHSVMTRPQPSASCGAISGNASSADGKFTRQEPIGPFIADFVCREKMLSMTIDEIIDPISRPAKVTIAFVDARRNDPFHRGAGDRGFEPIAVPLSRQIYIGMSTQIGKTALDGDSGEGSPFARAFVEKMATPGLRIDDAFRALRSEVSRLTEGRQQPEVLQDDLNEGATMLMKAP